MEREDTLHNDALYNVRIIKTYIEYLEKYYPDIDVDEILEQIGMTRHHLEDPGVWYTQEVADRFQEIIRKKTRNPRIARDAGRYVASSRAYKVIREYIHGVIGPGTAYSMLPKIHSKVSRSSILSVRSLGRCSREVVTTPMPGVSERPYQCENRIGQFEALARIFTGRYAKVEHPECIHKKNELCRYIVSWKEPFFLRLRRYRNIAVIAGILAFPLVFLLVDIGTFLHALEYFGLMLFAVTCLGLYLESRDYRGRIEEQAHTAELLIAESNARYNDATLIQEMGRAIASSIDIDQLLETVVTIMKNRLDFERGCIFLADETKTRLVFRAGYGLDQDQGDLLRKTHLHLDKPHSKGPLVVCFKEKRPIFVDNADTIIEDLSPRSREILNVSGSRSFICVPVVFEEEALGVVAVDRTNTGTPLRQHDVNLLLGIAPQIAISINNARMFERLLASEEKYRDLVEGANSIILRVDREGRITFVNKYACTFYGYEEQEMLGRKAVGFILPEIDSQGRDMRRIMGEFFACPVEYKAVENENLTKKGERVWVSWSTRVARDRDGAIREILCVGNDVTARRVAEEEKRLLENQLIHAQKMEAIGNLAGGVAHDLNNILSGVIGYPELLLMELPPDSHVRKIAETIKRSGEKAASMVQDLLTLARRGVRVSGVVDLNQVVDDYFSSPEFKKLKEYHPGAVFEVSLHPDAVHVAGSEVHLGKALMNLVSNAAEAMPGGGRVIVRTSIRRLEEPVHGYETIDAGEYVVLSVEDTGVGMTAEDQKKIFEPFFTKKTMGRSGTGLGMTVVWSTVKDHKGRIDITSAPGEGTRFDIYFPLSREAHSKIVKEGPLHAYVGQEHILVVDDGQEQRGLCRQLLERLGYRVTTVSSGEDAVDYLKDHGADLVLLDMFMGPGLDGLDTYRKILEIHGAQKAVIMSGFSETERVKKALELGAGSFLSKPFTLETLARAVRAELDRGRTTGQQ